MQLRRLFRQIGTNVADKLPRYIHPFEISEIVCYVAERPPLEPNTIETQSVPSL